MKDIRICNIPLRYYIPLLVILIISLITNKLGSDVIGVFAFLYLISGLLFFVGDKIPFVGKNMGGSLLLPLFGGSALVFFNAVPEDLLFQTEQFISSGFIDLVLGTVIVGAILSLDRNALIKTSVRLMPAILGAQLVAILFLIAASKITGRSIIDGVYMTGLPNFCGGSSGGVVALPSMYSEMFGGSIGSYAGKFIVLLNIANVVCILFAGILNGIGKKFPKLTGNGKLLDIKEAVVQSQAKDNIEEEKKVDGGVYIAVGCIISVIVLVFARLVSAYLPFLNYIVWATIFTILLKVFNLDNEFI